MLQKNMKTLYHLWKIRNNNEENVNVFCKEDSMAIVNLNEENFEKEVLNEDKTVLVDFWSPTCGPCRMLSPIIDEIADERTDVKVCKVNTSEEFKLAIEYNVEMIPTLIVFKDGKAVKRNVGFMPKEEVLKML